MPQVTHHVYKDQESKSPTCWSMQTTADGWQQNSIRQLPKQETEPELAHKPHPMYKT